jgi:hypothetical protein
MNRVFLTVLLFFGLTEMSSAQSDAAGWFSLGGRSTISMFDHDGVGIGTGGHFRIQFSKKINTDWFADYISIDVDDKVRSEYYHIGWSVIVYPLNSDKEQVKWQPYIVAGHCFDYNKKTVITQNEISKDRWGSAVQAGIGTHYNLTPRCDISLTSQYMIHLTNELEVETEDNVVSIVTHKSHSLEGHLLTTLSVNYKIAHLWRK